MERAVLVYLESHSQKYITWHKNLFSPSKSTRNIVWCSFTTSSQSHCPTQQLCNSITITLSHTTIQLYNSVNITLSHTTIQLFNSITIYNYSSLSLSHCPTQQYKCTTLSLSHCLIQLYNHTNLSLSHCPTQLYDCITLSLSHCPTQLYSTVLPRTNHGAKYYWAHSHVLANHTIKSCCNNQTSREKCQNTRRFMLTFT